MDEREVRERLRKVQSEHRALDAMLSADERSSTDETPAHDASSGSDGDTGLSDIVGRMRAKKLKLRLRDEIVALESMLIPDIMA